MIPGVPEPDAAANSNADGRVAGRAGRAAALGLLCFFVFNANLRFIGSYDSVASSLLPFNLLQGRGLSLDRYGDYPPDFGYSIVRAPGGRLMSLYPIVTPLLVTPLYLPVAFTRLAPPPIERDQEYFRIFMERIAASVLASLSVALLYLTIVRFLPGGMAVALSLLYAFGTSTWTIASQALWQHGTAQLLLSLALYLLYVRAKAPATPALLGVLAALIVFNRPADLLFGPMLALIAVGRWRRRSWPFFGAALATGLPFLVYNLRFFGTLSGGYSLFPTNDGIPVHVGQNPFPGFLHLLLSNRGLFLFSPFFLFFLRPVPPAGSTVPRAERLVLAAGVVGVLLFHSSLSTGWWGGYTYGPRYAVDGLPVLIFLLAPHLRSPLGLPSKLLVGVTAAVAIFIQAIGAFCYPGGDSGTAGHGFWTLSKSPPLLALGAGPQHPHFLGFVAPGLPMTGPVPHGDLRARLEWDVPARTSIPAGVRRSVRLEVENGGPIPWSSFGYYDETHSVRLVTRWEMLGGLVAKATPEKRHWLAVRVAPGSRVRRTISVQGPASPGLYRLVLDVVQVGSPSVSPLSRAAREAEVQVLPPEGRAVP